MLEVLDTTADPHADGNPLRHPQAVMNKKWCSEEHHLTLLEQTIIWTNNQPISQPDPRPY